jgi:hypothetical protein
MEDKGLKTSVPLGLRPLSSYAGSAFAHWRCLDETMPHRPTKPPCDRCRQSWASRSVRRVWSALAGGSGMAPVRQRQAVRQMSFLSAAFFFCSRAISFSSTARSSGAATHAQPTSALAAERNLAGLHVEPHEAVGDLAEAVTSAGRCRVHRVFGTSGRGQSQGRDGDGKSLADHGHLLAQPNSPLFSPANATKQGRRTHLPIRSNRAAVTRWCRLVQRTNRQSKGSWQSRRKGHIYRKFQCIR